MMRLAAQVELLARRVDDLPTVVDDELIIESLSNPFGSDDVLPEILMALFVRIAPALLASFQRGVESKAFCAARGIAWDSPVGEFDRRALSQSTDGLAFDDPVWVGTLGGSSVVSNAGNENPHARVRAVHVMRDYLAQVLRRYRHEA